MVGFHEVVQVDFLEQFRYQVFVDLVLDGIGYSACVDMFFC